MNRRLVPILICLLTAPLFLWGLGDLYLWTDEAQTARLGQSVLQAGVPLTGCGPDSASAHCADEAGIGGLHLQIAWMQAYLAAMSIGLFGATSLAARLPFALLGWACVPLSGWVAGRAGGRWLDRVLAMALTGTSVYFLLHARQARYYGPAAFLVLLSAGAYLAPGNKPGSRRLLLASSLCALVLTFDVTALGMLFGLTLLIAADLWHSRHSQPLSRQKVIRAFAPLVPAGLLLVAWIAVASTAPSRRAVTAGSETVIKVLYYLVQTNAHLAPVLLVGPLAILVFLRRDRDPGRFHGLVVISVLAFGMLLAALAPPLTFPRYFIAAAPLVLTGVALLAGSLATVNRRWGVATAAAVSLLLVVGTPQKLSHDLVRNVAGAVGFGARVWHPSESWSPPLLELLAELREPPEGPLAAVVRYLGEQAEKGDVIVTTYGVPSLRFHTDLDPYGGRTCELPPTTRPDWIWLRAGWDSGSSGEVLEWIAATVDLSRYERIELPVFDRLWENREDFHQHVFRDPGPQAPNVVLYRLLPEQDPSEER